MSRNTYALIGNEVKTMCDEALMNNMPVGCAFVLHNVSKRSAHANMS